MSDLNTPLQATPEAIDTVNALIRLHAAAKKGDRHAKSMMSVLGMEGKQADDILRALADAFSGDPKAKLAADGVLLRALGVTETSHSDSVTNSRSAPLPSNALPTSIRRFVTPTHAR